MADITIKNYVIIAHEQGVTAYPINSTNLTFKTIKTLLKGYCEIITGVYKLSQILHKKFNADILVCEEPHGAPNVLFPNIFGDALIVRDNGEETGTWNAEQVTEIFKQLKIGRCARKKSPFSDSKIILVFKITEESENQKVLKFVHLQSSVEKHFKTRDTL